jgi:hypothetical protein
LTVDGTHCPIYEPRPFSTKWSSHKLGGAAGLDYEIALRIHKPQCVWVNGPFPAGTNDITIYKEALKEKIPPGKKVIGDKGYKGEHETISTWNEFDPREVGEFKERAQARQETFNARIKNWACLTKKFRQDHELHKACFESIVVLQQYEMDNGSQEPLFDAFPAT